MGFFDLFKSEKRSVSKEADVEEPKTSMEEDLLDSIRQFRARQENVREKYLQESDEKMAPVHEKIRRAENLMKKSGLDCAVPKVMKHIWHWASWSKKDSFSEYTAFSVTNVSGEKDTLYEWDVSFDYDGHRFRFSFHEEKSNYETDSKYADVSLSYDDENVLEINCRSSYDREYDQWDYLSVKHLIVGEWVRAIVEMDELIKLYDIKSSREFGESMYRKKAENLPD